MLEDLKPSRIGTRRRNPGDRTRGLSKQMPGRGQGLQHLRKGGQPIVQIGRAVPSPTPTPSSQPPLRDIAAATAKQANLATVKLELGQNRETATYKGGGQISSHAGETETHSLETSKGHVKQPLEQANCEATRKGVGQITSEVVTESQHLILDKHLRSRVVSCQSPCPFTHPSSRQRTPTCNRTKKEMDTNGTRKGHVKQPVEQANCEATHNGVGQITSEAVTESQNLILDKNLRSRVVSCQSPCPSTHPSSRQRTPTCNRAKKEMDTNSSVGL